jgi:hypothetical protein
MKDKAQQFCNQVRKLAQEYGVNFFVITDGASAVSNDGNAAIKAARESHEKWELENGYDPHHNNF